MQKTRFRSINKKTKEVYDQIVNEGKAIYYKDLANPITIKGDIITIHCLRKGKLYKILIDREDVDKVELGYSVSLVEKGGLYARVNGSIREYIHRVIIDCPEDMVIDHINNDSLDNRRANLRVITQEENLIYKKKPKDNKTGRKNISISKDGYYNLSISRTFINRDTAEEALDKIERIIQHYSAIDARERAENRLTGTR